MLTAISALIGIAAGALQGYYGGWVDLLGQRLLEVWSGLPVLYLLIILSGFVEPNFWWLLGIMALFSWLASGGCGARRVPARAQPGIRQSRAGAGPERPQGDVGTSCPTP
jgi:ABC-type microcin C transport system permease subunit YejE